MTNSTTTALPSRQTSTTFDREKVTVYYTSEFLGNIVKHEGKLLETGRKKYAQYDSAPYVNFIPKRKRNAVQIMKTFQPYILVVRGWDAPDPEEHMKVISASKDCVVSQSKYRSFDKRYKTDFNSIIDEAIKNGKIEVIADFRNVDSYNMLMDEKKGAA